VGIPDDQQPVSQELYEDGELRPESAADAVVFFGKTPHDAGKKPVQEIVEKSGDSQVGVHLIAESGKTGEVEYGNYRFLFLAGCIDIAQLEHSRVEFPGDFMVKQLYSARLAARDSRPRMIPSYTSDDSPFH
jgi:hypothetical protein